MGHIGRIDDPGHATFSVDSGQTVTKNMRVLLNSNGDLEVAGVGDAIIGTALRDPDADGNVTVRLLTAPSHEMIAAGAITAYGTATAAAGGKIEAGAGSLRVLNAATADGDVVLVISDA